ncbi:hypothetical protein HELRODRAFT_183584 [Helobdella robusta]|uniref:Zinc finger PHD-type domain-containing protein n=1 Tax=Helobdella robusta TaxID=6412 RepID=T1FJV7_HELRO|nr:hypothetical protein HELRODRAFT_183584 [Helobdella robusta]ESO10484.1 hypothetical protein HELRODRAFT_183584 [Helobdella robusta]
MPRSYKRKSARGSYGEESLRQALAAIHDGTPVKTAARQYGIPQRTLRRHRDKKVLQPEKLKLGRFELDIPIQYEKELVSLIQNMEKALFGLSIMDVRKLAYDFAEKIDLEHRFSNETKMAGVDWIHGFLRRNNQLSIRQPEATNISRAVGFNQEKNVDETGISTVQKPVKVVATKGTRLVGRMTSGERGQTTTVMCAFNAAGMYIPPMFIFPRKLMVDSLMNEAPPEDFFASKLTDEPLPNTVTLAQQTPESVKPAQDVDHAKKDHKTTLLKIMGQIKIDNVRIRKRKSEKAALLTSSPYKNLLEKRENSKTMSKRQLIKGSGKEKKKKIDCEPCNTCQLKYCDDVTGRNWIQCQSLTCSQWYHNECQGLDENYNEQFICIDCENSDSD